MNLYDLTAQEQDEYDSIAESMCPPVEAQEPSTILDRLNQLYETSPSFRQYVDDLAQAVHRELTQPTRSCFVCASPIQES